MVTLKEELAFTNETMGEECIDPALKGIGQAIHIELGAF
jgi:hypothetical protein